MSYYIYYGKLDCVMQAKNTPRARSYCRSASVITERVATGATNEPQRSSSRSDCSAPQLLRWTRVAVCTCVRLCSCSYGSTRCDDNFSVWLLKLSQLSEENSSEESNENKTNGS